MPKDPTTYVALFCRETPPRCRLCANPGCTHDCHAGDTWEPGLGWPRNERGARLNIEPEIR